MRASTAPDRWRAPRTITCPTDAVLTAEGRSLLELRATELRTVTVPTLLRAVAADGHDEQTRAAYDDKLEQLLRLESMLAEAGPIPAQPGVSVRYISAT